MKKIVGDKIYTIKELQELVIVKLRTLGFMNVSEESLYTNETHRSLFEDAIEVEKNNLALLNKEFSDVLTKLKNL